MRWGSSGDGPEPLPERSGLRQVGLSSEEGLKSECVGLMEAPAASADALQN